MSKKLTLDLVEGACLVLVNHGISHGYQLAKQFEASATIGEVLTLSRPVVYRAVKVLEKHHLLRGVEATGTRGQLKWQLKCTAEGERLAKQWLSEPVSPIRDLRNEFLVKILLSQTTGANTSRLIKNQRQVLKAVTATLLADRAPTPVAIWRREQARTSLRFLDELEGATGVVPKQPTNQLMVSARNQLKAKVAKVKHGDTLSTVYLNLEPDQTMTSTITRDAATDLSLSPGSQVVALFKATEVMIATTSS